MGLSNEERVYRSYFDINAMVNISKNLEGADYGCIIEMIKKMWSAFLFSSSNSSHWIFGSGSVGEVTCETLSPWGVAIRSHLDGIQKRDEEDYSVKYKFDAFDGFLDIKGLLDRNKGKIYYIYQLTENLIYTVRRYDDGLRKDMKVVDDLISDIQGECFRIFNDDEDYATAYVLSSICKLIYGDGYDRDPGGWDTTTRWLSEHHVHHHLSRPMTIDHCDPALITLKDLSKMHLDMYNLKCEGKLSQFKRIYYALKISGRRFHYNHEWDYLKTLMSNDKVFLKSDIIKLKSVFDENVKNNIEYEKKGMEEYKERKMSPMSVYGFEYEIENQRRHLKKKG